MQKIIKTLVLAVTLFSCSAPADKDIGTDNQTTDTSDIGLPEQEYVTDPKDKQIISIPDTLYRGDTLRIRFKTPHSKEFAIVAPDDHFYYVINPDLDTKMPSLVSPDKFTEMEFFEIITDKTKVSPYDANINQNVIMFTQTGKYVLKLSDVLCTDDGTPVEEETIYYIDEPRQK